MPRDDAVRRASTRRAFAKYGGTVALGGLLAGCTDGGGAGSSDSDSPDADTTDTGSTDDDRAESQTEDAADASYTASIRRWAR